MNPRWLLRASRWARHPPPARRVVLVLAVVAACLALAGIERLVSGPRTDAGPAPRPFTTN